VYVSQIPDLGEVPVNLYAYRYGILNLPQQFECFGITMRIIGTLDGVTDLTIGKGCKLELSKFGNTVGQSSSVFSFHKLTVLSGGEVYRHDDDPDTPITLEADIIDVRGGGVIRSPHLHINAQNLTVRDGGVIHADVYQGDACDSAELGVGGSGAGHGGSGGRSRASARVGIPRGHIFEPYHPGCRGGSYSSYSGAYGGGVLKLNITGRLLNDGIVHANAAHASGRAGGGSGGSIWIWVNHIAGYGQFNVIGGNGGRDTSYPGGGGAGGRIALYFERNETFIGEWYTQGGVALGSQSSETGGSGTFFAYHLHHQHRSLIINNRDLPYQPEPKSRIPSYTDITQDGGRTWILPTSQDHFLAEPDGYVFEELQLYGGVHFAVMADSSG
jgi:hypothetical protein